MKSKRQLNELFSIKKPLPTKLVISCSDHRIFPAKYKGTALHDLFYKPYQLRSFGNLVAPYEAGNEKSYELEFLLNTLGITDIIIMGHTQCPFLEKSFQSNGEGSSCDSTEKIKYLKTQPPSQNETEQSKIRAQENVLKQVDNLLTYPIVCQKIEQGKLKLQAWVYQMEAAELLFYDNEIKEFIPAAELIREYLANALE